MSPDEKCPRCGEHKSQAISFQELCPRCLLLLGLGGDLEQHRTIGPYEILDELGQGAMGAVYKAYHPDQNRVVALKTLIPHLAQNPLFIKRFEQEAQVIAQLNHPNHRGFL